MKLTGMILTLMLLFSATAPQVGAAPQLFLGSVDVKPGETASLDLGLSEGTEPYAGVNAKILLPEGTTVADISKGELLSEGDFNVVWRTFSLVEHGCVTVVVYSGTDTFSTSNGVLLTLKLDVSGSVEPGTYTVRFTDSDTNPLVNSKYALSNSDGTRSISMDPPAPGYVKVVSVGDFLDPVGVDFIDFAVFAAQWGKRGCNQANNYCEATDFDQSTRVDYDDVATFANTWLAAIQVPAAAAASRVRRTCSITETRKPTTQGRGPILRK